ncbi:MAG TPA: secondary thiamine-phosphate synthase enzyme YjbQ [Candidatus Krumholzibacteriaceae bacterium]|nr:secondary thiamine-phosphate synthase enzyme YjbQ [Candidatus Krumholzibacteriaceae bacterium]
MIKEIRIRTNRRNELQDITAQINAVISESEIKEGLCHIFVPHTTAAVTINEKADPDVAVDISGSLSRIVPAGWDYKHAEGNSDSHIKSSCVGPSEFLIIKDSKPLLGTWQAIFFCEFDGPRTRRCVIRVSK